MHPLELLSQHAEQVGVQSLVASLKNYMSTNGHYETFP
jgi:hypothetical protein